MEKNSKYGPNDKYGPNGEYKPTHCGYSEDKRSPMTMAERCSNRLINLHCDDCTVDKMATRHAEVCDELNKKKDYIKALIARINALESGREGCDFRIEDLETRNSTQSESIRFLRIENQKIENIQIELVEALAQLLNTKTELSRRKVEIALLEERLNPKPKWAEGVIAVDEKREVEPGEEGLYWHWYKDRVDDCAEIIYKGGNSMFSADFIYELAAFVETKPPQPKPL